MHGINGQKVDVDRACTDSMAGSLICTFIISFSELLHLMVYTKLQLDYQWLFLGYLFVFCFSL